MAGISLQQAQQRLDDWLAADAAVSKNQSYRIADRTYTRADAEVIRRNIEFWDGKVKKLSRAGGAGIRVRGITPTG